MNTDSTVLISKYLKEYNHIYKEANDIYHEIARKLQLSDSALDIFYTIFEMGDNCLQRDICKASCMPKQTVNSSIRKLQTDGYLTLSPEKAGVCISILPLPVRSLFRKNLFLSSVLRMMHLKI